MKASARASSICVASVVVAASFVGPAQATAPEVGAVSGDQAASQSSEWLTRSRAATRAATTQLDYQQPASCFTLKVFREDRSFGDLRERYTGAAAEKHGCAESEDGHEFVQRIGSTWVSLDLSGTSWDCKEWKAAVAKARVSEVAKEYLDAWGLDRCYVKDAG